MIAVETAQRPVEAGNDVGDPIVVVIVIVVIVLVVVVDERRLYRTQHKSD